PEDSKASAYRTPWSGPIARAMSRRPSTAAAVSCVAWAAIAASLTSIVVVMSTWQLPTGWPIASSAGLAAYARTSQGARRTAAMVARWTSARSQW
ncbi:MAG: hypothetical protein M3680_36000, partial [Myxococcota bacterium]|nr:hypothetical protein [Myxococcota bacterium]